MSYLSENESIAYYWLPESSRRILDAGCSWGYEAASYVKQGRDVYGIDVNERYIAKGIRRYPTVKFLVCGIEKTPFENEFFDAVVLSEVLEHVTSEINALNEIHRILAPHGICIITVPHKGLFGFLDPGNYKYYIGRFLSPIVSVYRNKTLHRHYSYNDILRLLDNSQWKNSYIIKQKRFWGLFAGVLLGAVRHGIKTVAGNRLSHIVMQPFFWMAHADNNISYGKYSYHMAVKLIKIKTS